MPVVAPIAPIGSFDIDDDDEEGWEDMPVVREDHSLSGLDEEDQKKYHYDTSAKVSSSKNATGNLIDFDDSGYEWRTKLDNQNESEYTRLRGHDEDESDEVHMRTKYLFDEDKAMTPLSQMQATKNLLTEAQRIAYVGLCSLITQEMTHDLKRPNRKEFKGAVQNTELWALKIMGRLYYHMEVQTQEQKMIESLSQHGVQAMDLVPALMTTHTVANPEYDPAEARRKAKADEILFEAPPTPMAPTIPQTPATATFQTTARVLADTSTAAIPGVSTTLSTADENVTLDIRWTVLCDLFLILIADSVYDARSRVLLERAALKLGLGWIDVVRFESRVTEALEIQEDVDKMEQQEVIEGRQKAARKKRYMMLGLATLGGGLVIGLSAGLLAPVIGAGLGAALGTVGITGTTGFLAGAGGAAVITTGGVLTGSGIAMKGMINRTQFVRTFEILPLHNNKRVSAILTVPGFMTGKLDDVRLPFSVLDPVVGDVFSVLWEPEMIQETGSALKILTTEVLTQIGQTVLQATVMTALMSALQWPIILTKLGYLIDNPWNNALDRAKAAGSVLAQVLVQRHLGVRPITLIGFSLGARVIFYALIELAKQKAYGVVQDVFLMGATLSVSTQMWCDTRSVVSGRYVNAYARNDWVLNYLFRATSGGVGTVAGLRPVENVPGLENVDVTDKIAGHMSYRTFMPLILDQLGFPVFADFFDDPVEPDFEGDRIVEREEDKNKKSGWFSNNKPPPRPQSVSRPPTASSFSKHHSSTEAASATAEDYELPPRIDSPPPSYSPASPTKPQTDVEGESKAQVPTHAGFDFAAIKDVLGKAELNPEELRMPEQNPFQAPHIPPPTYRSESAPPPLPTPPAVERPLTPELATSLARSLSVNDVHEEDETETETESEEEAAPPPIPAKASSFADTSLWDKPNPSQTSFGYAVNATPNPFASSTLSFGGPDGSISFGGADGSITGLSFGGVDGSISHNAFAAPTSTDSWTIPNDIGRGKKPAFSSSNPWG
ncbi:hypothetical protein MIND_00557000 [Mycena indigotica]|uniref:DUF726-domain-containing protein n=1 Tax=Mycena indigotica TaxID=2126181 RepID=A0A8H6SX73_9AGAR|nr:uncharacterized protein MIND_00557000 [Mycena indigotica]KAF7307618.1 hypothetical protein MIND_00557000 [Mycena indigotica]